MTSLLAAAAVAAVLELDVASFGQFMLGRPLVVGPILGYLLGEPLLGAGMGVVFELFSLGALPVGGRVPLNGVVGVAATLLLCAGGGLAQELAFAVGVATAALHGRLEAWGRRRRAAGLSGLDAAVKQLAYQAAGTFALLCAMLVVRAVASEIALPAPVTGGLRLGLALAPFIGATAALASLRGAS